MCCFISYYITLCSDDDGVNISQLMGVVYAASHIKTKTMNFDYFTVK